MEAALHVLLFSKMPLAPFGLLAFKQHKVLTKHVAPSWDNRTTSSSNAFINHPLFPRVLSRSQKRDEGIARYGLAMSTQVCPVSTAVCPHLCQLSGRSACGMLCGWSFPRLCRCAHTAWADRLRSSSCCKTAQRPKDKDTGSGEPSLSTDGSVWLACPKEKH